MNFLRLISFVTIPLYVLDQLTKWWAVSTFTEPPQGYFGTPDEPIPVIPGFLNWTRVHNQGVAFGLGNGTNWAPFIFPIVLLAAAVMVLYLWRAKLFTSLTSKFAAGLLLAGILGNFTDRMAQGFFLKHLADEGFWTRLKAGYVVDFIDVTIPIISYRWPTFNVADSCISVAACLLVFSSLRDDLQTKKKPTPDQLGAS